MNTLTLRATVAALALIGCGATDPPTQNAKTADEVPAIFKTRKL